MAPDPQKSRNSLLQMLGPGLLYAGAAIGVSHLVQSTKAGATFGFGLLWVVVAANIIKYPFFEAGPRYAAAKGESLIEGYARIGGWAVALFLIVTIGSMWVIQAAVTVVTAGLAQYLLGLDLAPWLISGLLLAVCMAVLGIGQYKILDRLIKIIIVVLSITTVIAVVAALFATFQQNPAFMQKFSWASREHVMDHFIPLVGWMPAPIDIAIWHSVWSLAKNAETKRKFSLKESLLDFKIGYWGTTILAGMFVALGALVIYGSGQELASSGGAFARQLIEMYAAALGPAFKPVIGIAAFTTMFSTTLTCFDAFPRVLRRSTVLLWPSIKNKPQIDRKLYWMWILIVGIGAVIILRYFVGNMGQMVTFATTLSFLTAPILATLNFMAVTGKDMPVEHRPGKGLRYLSIAGLIFLYSFSIYYLLF